MNKESNTFPLVLNYDVSKIVGKISITEETLNVLLELFKAGLPVSLGGSFVLDEDINKKSKLSLKLLSLCVQSVTKPPNERQKYHDLLELSFDNTKQGNSFLPEFIELVMKEHS